MALTVKGRPATNEQLNMGRLIVETTRGRGGDAESCAGAVATALAIQESTLSNLRGGDRDSAGLYQQRPSMTWGSYQQITTPSYAIGKFLDQYLSYRRQGLGWLQASHKTQRSAHPNAPAQWYNEGVAFTQQLAGSGGGATGYTSGGGGEIGTQPYEFSRGSGDGQKETSWDCMGRLMSETGWRRYVSGGALWLVSDDYLIRQPPSYRISEWTAGVVGLSFEAETRKQASEASLRVVTRRWSFLPGMCVEIVDEGPGDGKWLVKEIRRNLNSQISDITLTRRQPKLPEPAAAAAAPQAAAGAGVGAGVAPGGTLTGDLADRVYQAAEEATRMNWRYSQEMRGQQRSGGYADCSSGVAWVLHRAGVPVPGPTGPLWPVSGSFIRWGQAGRGQRVTIWTNAGHIWIQWHGKPNWRFDTGGGSGGRNWPTPRSTGGFVARHWQGT